MSKHLSQDEFFTALTALFTTQKQSQKGTILLTQKRYSYDESAKETLSEQEHEETLTTTTLPQAPILIRASNSKPKEARNEGKKVKLSTIVQPDDLDSFYARYADVCKAGMSGLKPRDRTKRKAKEKARRKMKTQA
ncbi:hypothetical protein QC762_505790 [Podospora pseudocomata]|uniref:Signal recognition particle subunit SRP14 n=1 Tax=Podospora pseudocomata TaxID=2093779 RepID=A0ABR0GBV7_9PEZI|nr:hypothetical protein QC762_505790 [Podospora pseudocomata]